MTVTPKTSVGPEADSAPRGLRAARIAGWARRRDAVAPADVAAAAAAGAGHGPRRPLRAVGVGVGAVLPEPGRSAGWLRASRLTRFLRATGLEAAVRRLQQADARHPVVVDGLFTAGLLLLGAPRLIFEERGDRPLVLAVCAVMLLPLVFRRRAPFAVFGVVAAGAWAEYLSGVPQPVANMGLLVALYTVASRSSLGKILAAGAVMELGAALAAHHWTVQRVEPRVFVLLSGTVVAAAVLGLNTRTRRAYLATLEDRARQLELERDQQAEIAAAAERASIAREVHDIVTHSLSVMVALTDGASFAVHTAPDKAADAIGKASEVGRQAIGDMQRVLGVLRSRGVSDPVLEPQPGLDQLDALLSEVRAAGLPVELVVRGTSPVLTSGMELAVYRVVQEALTNTRKHAVGAAPSARVEMRFGDGMVDLTVVDDGGGSGERWPGRPVVGAARSNGGGHGIAGMRERVAVYGGTVEAGPVPAGSGWRVHARLPLPLSETPSSPVEIPA